MSTSFRSHDELEVLMAAEALGGLDHADGARLEQITAEHGLDCPECMELREGFAEAAWALASSLDPVALSEGAEDRLLAAARSTGPRTRGSPAFLPRPAARAEGARARRWIPIMAVAAAVAIVAGAVGYAVAPRGPGAQRAFAAFVSQPGTKVVPFPSHGGERLAVAFHPGESTAWLVGANLPALANDRVYELWFRPGPNAPVQPAGTFVSQDGVVLSTARVGPSFDVLAVSVEPSGGSRQPTTEPIFVAPV